MQMDHLGKMYLKTFLNMEKLEIPSPLRPKNRLCESGMEIVAGRSELILYHVKRDGLWETTLKKPTVMSTAPLMSSYHPWYFEKIYEGMKILHRCPWAW